MRSDFDKEKVSSVMLLFSINFDKVIELEMYPLMTGLRMLRLRLHWTCFDAFSGANA